MFLTALSGLLHATALVGSAGVTAVEFLPEALQTLTDIPAMLAGEDRPGTSAGVHPGDLSTATMMGATADHIVGASEAAGIDLELPRAIRSHYDGPSPPATAPTAGPASSRSCGPRPAPAR